MEAIQTEEYRGETIEVFQDEDMEDPRAWGGLGKMVCFHKRYNLGDKHNYHYEDYDSWYELKEAICWAEPVALISPLFLYDHSGTSIKIGSFWGVIPENRVMFDSGQVGFIYALNKDIRDTFKVERISKKTLQKAEDYLGQEVDTYNKYLSGDVYGYTTTSGGSCWGFYDIEEMLKEARNSIDNDIKCKTKEHCSQVKRWIQTKLPLVYRTAMA